MSVHRRHHSIHMYPPSPITDVSGRSSAWGSGRIQAGKPSPAPCEGVWADRSEHCAWGSLEGRWQAHGTTQRGLGNRRHYVFDSKSLTRGKAARLRVSVPGHTGHGDSHERLDETQKLWWRGPRGDRGTCTGYDAGPCHHSGITDTYLETGSVEKDGKPTCDLRNLRGDKWSIFSTSHVYKNHFHCFGYFFTIL